MALVEIRQLYKSFQSEAQSVVVYDNLTIDFEEGQLHRSDWAHQARASRRFSTSSRGSTSLPVARLL